MVFERSSVGLLSKMMMSIGAEVGVRPFHVSAAVLQCYDEVVFRVVVDGYIELVNLVAIEFAVRFSFGDLECLVAVAVKFKMVERVIVDMVDIGCG